MKIIASQRRSVIWVDGHKENEIPLPTDVVLRISELEQADKDRKQSIPRPRDVAKALDAHRAHVRYARRTLDAEKYALENLTRAVVFRQYPDVSVVWSEDGHECKDSVIGTCVYDDDSDPCWDDCLVCHEPEERK